MATRTIGVAIAMTAISDNQLAFRQTQSTVSTLAVVCVVMVLALYHLSGQSGPLSTTDNLIATVAYIAAFVLPFLLLSFLANVVTMIWCWPKRTADGESVYVEASKLRLRRWIAYGVFIVITVAMLAVAYLQAWMTVY